MEAGPQRPRRKAQPKHAWTLWASASALGLDVSISVRKALMARTRSAAAGCRILSRKAAKVSGCVDGDKLSAAGGTLPAPPLSPPGAAMCCGCVVTAPGSWLGETQRQVRRGVLEPVELGEGQALC